MLIRGIRMRKIGAAGRSYSRNLPKGSAVKIAVQEHGYELEADIRLNYDENRAS